MRNIRELEVMLPLHIWCFFLFLVFIKSSADSKNLSCNANDLNTLRNFLNGLESGIPGWSANESSSNCCDWPGVSCDRSTIFNPQVVGLNLTNMSLRGSISDSVARLNKLKIIDFSVNKLSGTIPQELFHLPFLEFLSFSTNQLSGLIPQNLSLPAIRVFNVSANSFSGYHPTLTGSKYLRTFDVADNNFYGQINASICNFGATIQVIRFSMNKFSGEFPKGLCKCNSLVELSLGFNSITGNLPENLFRISSLKQLYLQANFLSGNLSPSISYLINIVNFDLSFNMFSGFIPDAFGNLTKLESFSAMRNQFIGNLPISLCNTPSLKLLNLNNNSLSGMIMINCTVMDSLNFLDLGSNNFSGSIPDDLPKCMLKVLNLARNNLQGEIPNSFGNFIQLTDLSLTGNHFSNISSALQILQHIPNLTSLIMTKSFRESAVMPGDGIQGLHKLEVLVVAYCALKGSIPAWLANLTQLKVLDMSWNHLSGTVPLWFQNLENLFYLDLSNNSLTGELPNGLTKLKSLMFGNQLKQVSSFKSFPVYIKRNGSQKSYQYRIFPPSLILCANMLDGPILPGLGDLVNLAFVDLSWNNFSGTIPDELLRMKNLEYLDLSHNYLTGGIPFSFTRLSFLSNFDVAYNNLSGAIPTGGQFSTFASSDFEGNPGLCGNQLSPCASQVPLQPDKIENNRSSELGISIGIGVGTFFIVLTIYMVVFESRNIRIIMSFYRKRLIYNENWFSNT